MPSPHLPPPVRTVRGNIVDILNGRIFAGRIDIEDGRIARITPDTTGHRHRTYLLPGFVDSHVHIESSLLVPSEFARMAVVQGTVATVSDPHEIANVLGVAGVEYMIENGRTVPFKFAFGAPSCVPATPFETAGATVTPEEVAALLARPEIRYLSEMMNYPGVLNGDRDVCAKITAARRAGKPVDGHAPGLRGKAAESYIAAGITTDHECFTLAEALDKLESGLKYVLIREGSAARNFEALWPLLKTHPERCMLCSDDMHADMLDRGHINAIVRRAVMEKGVDPLKVLRAACINPVLHYGLPAGLLRIGDPADFIEVDNLASFTVLRTVIDGRTVAAHGESLISAPKASVINRFEAREKAPADFAVNVRPGQRVRVIEVEDGQLVTGKGEAVFHSAASNRRAGLLKIAVVNRYAPDAPPALGFVRNFGLKSGAIASSVAHDSHNIVAVGTNDRDLCAAINRVIAHRGGLSAVSARRRVDSVLPLPVAGLMTNEDGWATAHRYEELDALAKSLGTPLAAPFMTLSFLALLVIPSLKMSDRGLFDGERFEFTEIILPESPEKSAFAALEPIDKVHAGDQFVR